MECEWFYRIAINQPLRALAQGMIIRRLVKTGHEFQRQLFCRAHVPQRLVRLSPNQNRSHPISLQVYSRSGCIRGNTRLQDLQHFLRLPGTQRGLRIGKLVQRIRVPLQRSCLLEL